MTSRACLRSRSSSFARDHFIFAMVDPSALAALAARAGPGFHLPNLAAYLGLDAQELRVARPLGVDAFLPTPLFHSLPRHAANCGSLNNRNSTGTQITQ